jgi:hypothetical protein
LKTKLPEAKATTPKRQNAAWTFLLYNPSRVLYEGLGTHSIQTCSIFSRGQPFCTYRMVRKPPTSVPRGMNNRRAADELNIGVPEPARKQHCPETPAKGSPRGPRKRGERGRFVSPWWFAPFLFRQDVVRPGSCSPVFVFAGFSFRAGYVSPVLVFARVLFRVCFARTCVLPGLVRCVYLCCVVCCVVFCLLVILFCFHNLLFVVYG